MRTMSMTTAGLARKTADWESDSVAASDTGGAAAAREAGQHCDHVGARGC